MPMTEHQETALRFPCRFAFETGRPRFAWRIARGKASIVLSVNSGYE